MPDDLVLSTVLRCVEPNSRRRLQLVLDDTITYEILKEKLIFLTRILGSGVETPT